MAFADVKRSLREARFRRDEAIPAVGFEAPSMGDTNVESKPKNH